MPLVAALTLVGVAATVVVLAGYLIKVALILSHVVSRLETVLYGVGAVSQQAEPIGAVASAINADLEAAARALHTAMPEELQPRNGNQRTSSGMTR